LSTLPYDSSQIKIDAVSVVRELCCGKIPVYDLQVEGCNNFFAEEILTHNCLIIDDPHKDREQAESLTMREKVWDWWTGTARERLEPMPWAPFGVAIVMATRWNVDDFTGRLLGRKVDAEAEGQRYSPPWIEYRLPALAELDDPLGRQPGEALWPEKYPLPSLYAIKEDIGPYNWLSEYQQTPIRREGALFRQEYFRPVEVLG